MSPYLTVAQKIARETGQNVRYLFNQVIRLNEEQRADNDVFNQFYIEIEKTIAKEILSHFPTHSISGAYCGDINKEERHRWFISGVVGRENFRVGNPHFSLSIAYEMDSRLEIGLILNPMNDDIYMASRNDKAMYNDRRLRLNSSEIELEHCRFLTALSNDEEYQSLFFNMNRKVQSLRVLGDMALDIGAVLLGSYNGFFAKEYSLYDVKAAILIALESGFLVTDFKGAENRGEKETFLVISPRLLRSFLKLVRE